MLVRNTLIVLTLAAAAAAQRPIAYPQDSLTEGTGQIVPFGTHPTLTQFDEGHWQNLIPPTHLPTKPTFLTGIAVNSQVYSGPMTYTSLKLTFSPTPATSLSTTFAANLPILTVGLNATNFTVTYTSGQWTIINLTTPVLFPANGSFGLVLDVQKVYDRVSNPISGLITTEVSGQPPRSDLPPSIYTFGAFGSGAAASTTASFSTNVLKMRLLWRTEGTTVLSGPLTGGKVFAINSSIGVSVYAQNGDAFATLFDGSFTAPYSLGFINGFGVVLPNTLFTTGVVPVGDVATTNVTIPNNPLLIGQRIVFQSVVLNSGQLHWTNGTDAIVN